MNNSFSKKFVLIVIAAVFVIGLTGNVNPILGSTFSADRILVITETSVDNQLVTEIISLDNMNNDNYSVITLDDFNLMCNDGDEDCLNVYSTVVLLSINLTSISLDNQSIAMLTNRISSGMSFTIVSSKIWRLNNDMKDLLGVDSRLIILGQNWTVNGKKGRN